MTDYSLNVCWCSFLESLTEEELGSALHSLSPLTTTIASQAFVFAEDVIKKGPVGRLRHNLLLAMKEPMRILTRWRGDGSGDLTILHDWIKALMHEFTIARNANETYALTM